MMVHRSWKYAAPPYMPQKPKRENKGVPGNKFVLHSQRVKCFNHKLLIYCISTNGVKGVLSCLPGSGYFASSTLQGASGPQHQIRQDVGEGDDADHLLFLVNHNQSMNLEGRQGKINKRHMSMVNF